MRCIVLVSLGLVALAPSGAFTTNGTTLTVTNCSNQTDLQNAINAVPSGGTVTFACGTPSSPATIPITTSVVVGPNPFTLEGNGAVILSGFGISAVILDLSGTPATVRDMTITGGSSTGGGGAIKVAGTSATVINTTLYNNSALRGAGIFVLVGTATVINSTFSGNSATQIGNDVEADGGATINLENSIFLDGCLANGGVINDAGGNIDTGTSCIPNSTNGSLVNVGGAILGSLISNLYFPLANGSPAIALDAANCPSRDELGNPRASSCNAGAIQNNTPPSLPATPVPGSLWLGIAGLAILAIYSIWPSRIRTVRCP